MTKTTPTSDAPAIPAPYVAALADRMGLSEAARAKGMAMARGAV